MVCSTLKSENEEIGITKISCSDSLINFKNKKYPFYVECPNNCDLFKKFPVFGNLLYKGDSSICRSAIHSGFLKTSSKQSTNKIIQVIPSLGLKNYQGNFHNNIESFKYESNNKEKIMDKNEKMTYFEAKNSFMINPFYYECPIDYILNEYMNFKKMVKINSFKSDEDSLNLNDLEIISNIEKEKSKNDYNKTIKKILVLENKITAFSKKNFEKALFLYEKIMPKINFDNKILPLFEKLILNEKSENNMSEKLDNFTQNQWPTMQVWENISKYWLKLIPNEIGMEIAIMKK